MSGGIPSPFNQNFLFYLCRLDNKTNIRQIVYPSNNLTSSLQACCRSVTSPDFLNCSRKANLTYDEFEADTVLAKNGHTYTQHFTASKSSLVFRNLEKTSLGILRWQDDQPAIVRKQKVVSCYNLFLAAIRSGRSACVDVILIKLNN